MHRFKPWRLASIFAGALFSLSAFAQHVPSEVVIQPGMLNVETPSGMQQLPYELGTLYVPENRANPNSRIIPVGFARVKANGPATAPPTFRLPGGPGNTIIDTLQGRANKNLLQYLETGGDLVVVEQRGYTLQGEQLENIYQAPALPLDRPITRDALNASAVAMAEANTADYARLGIDLAGYTILECADDVNDLRMALGYSKVNLVGQSFGSQLSFAIMKRHPSAVARALLSGVEPLNDGYDRPSQVLAAIQRMAPEINKIQQYQGVLPPGGYMAAIDAILARLSAQPVTAQVTHPQTQQTFNVVLGLEDFQLFMSLNPEAFRAVINIYQGDYREWAMKMALLRIAGGAPANPILISWLIDSSTGITPFRELQLRRDPALRVFGTGAFDPYIFSAPVWPTADVGNAFRMPRPSRIPVLFINGNWDTSTPIENVQEIQSFFPNSRFIMVNRGDHGARSEIERTRPDVMAPVLQFLRNGSTSQLPTTVELPVPWNTR